MTAASVLAIMGSLGSGARNAQKRQRALEDTNKEFSRSLSRRSNISGFTPGVAMGMSAVAPFALQAGMELADAFTNANKKSQSGTSAVKETKEATEEAEEKAKAPTTTAKQDEGRDILDQIAEQILSTERFRKLFEKAGLEE